MSNITKILRSTFSLALLTFLLKEATRGLAIMYLVLTKREKQINEVQIVGLETLSGSNYVLLDFDLLRKVLTSTLGIKKADLNKCK